MTEIKGVSVVDVWLQGVTYLLEEVGSPYEELDIYLKVSDPLKLSPTDRKIYDLVDAFLTENDRAQSIHTVAETIFPYSYYRRLGMKGVLEQYADDMEEIWKGRSDSSWGCYAYRMLRRKDANGKNYNPLKHKIAHLKKHKIKRACFELDAGDPDMTGEALDFDAIDRDPSCDLATYDDRIDRTKTFGNLPCMSYLSMTVFGGALHLNATYRRHYYIERLLGNLVGLGRLQYALARETNLARGGITINSTLAAIDRNAQKRWGMAELRSLVESAIAVKAAAVSEAA